MKRVKGRRPGFLRNLAMPMVSMLHTQGYGQLIFTLDYSNPRLIQTIKPLSPRQLLFNWVDVVP